MGGKYIKFSDLFIFEKKSKKKAGDGQVSGKYKFFTSSATQNKYTDECNFENESLIFGTLSLLNL